MNQNNGYYNTFRRFPDLCKSFKEAETIDQIQQQRRKRRPHSAQVGDPSSYSYRSYHLHRKLKDLRTLSTKESDVLENSWSTVRLQQREKSAQRTASLIGTALIETPSFSPLESALKKLNLSGYPGIEEENRSFTLDVGGLYATLSLKPSDSADSLQIQLLRVLGVPLLTEEALQLHKFLLSQSASRENEL